ncbi:MAG: hypothetical protein JO295_15460 [Verrucomicrobia bacterium]|nr:hypothetical protein [Verrucomicrobiota bacterium]
MINRFLIVVCLMALAREMQAQSVGDEFALRAKADITEFAAKRTALFSTSGHPKAKGAKFSMRYPMSWKATETDVPIGLQIITSSGGKGLECVSIVANELPPTESASAAQVEAFFTPAGLQEIVPRGATFLTASPTMIQGERAGLIEYSWKQNIAGVAIHARFLVVVFFQQRTLVHIGFQVSVPAERAAELDLRFEAFRPLFQMMMLNIVFYDKWK